MIAIRSAGAAEFSAILWVEALGRGKGASLCGRCLPRACRGISEGESNVWFPLFAN